MADLVQMSEGMARQAETALRTAGGGAVLLRLPAPAVSGDDAEQLGLATPMWTDVELAPAVVRKLGSGATLMVSARAVEAVTGTLSVASADVLFATAAGVVVDGVVWTLLAWSTGEAAGLPCVYYLKVQRRQP